MSISYFSRAGNGFMPGEHAVGPWAPDMLHGRFFGGFAARAVEMEFLEAGWRVSRLTVDMFRPAGFELTEVTTALVRQGRRIKVVDVGVTVGGVAVASARAIVLAKGTPPPGKIWQADAWQSPHPETLPKMVSGSASPEDESGRSEETAPDGPMMSAWDLRVHEGGIQADGRARVWSNDTGALVDDEPLTPLVRAALNGDLASPLANGSAAGVGYINGDYTLAMARYPEGDWVGMETTTHLASDGIALGAVTLYDLDGPFGTSTTTALANPILS